MKPQDDIFGRFYLDAADYTGTPADLLATVNGPGAIWYERYSDRALVMDSIRAWRWRAGRGAGSALGAMVNAGEIVRDSMPLDDGVDIYAGTGKAVVE